MENKLLLNIVTICLRMDELAFEIYKNLSRISEDEKLMKFWEHMSQEESKHIICWKNLLKLVNDKIIPQIFIHPEDTFKQLEDNFKKINILLNKSSESLELTDKFVLAFRLEFYLLHPALEKLWHFYGIIQEEEYNPENEYDNHIHFFIEALQEFSVDSMQLEALGESLEQLWEQSRNIAKEANFDELTGLLNRRGYFTVMTSLASLAKRNDYNSAIFMIDIDHFKEVNDNLGHQTGDLVLKEVANLIKANIRSSDILGRFGGEEFLVFLPQIDIQSISVQAEKIRKSIEIGTQKSVAVTASIGCASMHIRDDVEEAITLLIKNADKKMYEAKRRGRNMVIC